MRWAGTDPTTRVGTYDVLVAVDDGGYRPWLSATTLTSATWTGEPGSRYSFATVARDVAGNTELPPVQPDAFTTFTTCDSDRFSDVGADHPFCDEITWMVGKGVTTGYDDGTFRPSAAVSRQAMAPFLYRAAGEPTFTDPTTASFSDVPVGHPFFTEIEWMKSTGISTGTVQPTGKPLYKPVDPVSRQAMAAFLQRFDGLAD